MSHHLPSPFWPAIFSGLKTVLESDPMPVFDSWGEEEFKAAQKKQLREHAARTQ